MFIYIYLLIISLKVFNQRNNVLVKLHSINNTQRILK
jgi:hypothetical protein